MKNRAFTLIELLVVIAIIAILAAILFPVFAQAKLAAKKAAAITQFKQTGTATILYTADYDDCGPLGILPDLSNPAVVRYKTANQGVLNPFDWTNDAGILQAEHALVWNNSTEPYRKNYQLLDYSGSKQAAGYNATSQVKAPQFANVTYNGHLQYYPFSSIAAPSTLPMFWQGQGDTSRRGVALSIPMLNCNGTGPCRMNPSGPPQADATGPGHSITLYITGSSLKPFAGTNIYIASDSSARAIQMGRGNQASGNARLNTVIPWQFINEDGTINSNQLFIRGWLTGQGTNFYVGAFVPENTFQN